MLPHFLVIGAQKAGTTTLFEHLRAHPEIFIPPDKEVHYFSEHQWNRGQVWYESLFAEAGDRICGEASPGYSWWPRFDQVPERIRAVVPEVRLVYILRHPIDRLVSHYRHDVYAGVQDAALESVITDWAEYVSRSQYAMQIRRYLDAGFRREQLHILTTEDLELDPSGVMSDVYRFVGVDPSFRPPTIGEHFNTGAGLRTERPMTTRLRTSRVGRLRQVVPRRIRRRVWTRYGSDAIDRDLASIDLHEAVRAHLADLLQEDLADLRQLLGPDFDCWGLLEDDAPS